MAEGIEVRHRKACRTYDGGRCSCSPTYRATVWVPEDERLARKSFPTLEDAKAWRRAAATAVDRGVMRAPTATTVEQACRALIVGMGDGTVLDRSGRRYKPATIRSYGRSVEAFIVPKLGRTKLSDLRRRDVQEYVDGFVRQGVTASTVLNRLDPLRVVCRRAIEDDDLAVNPTDHLRLPARRGKRDRVADVPRATRLLEALDVEDRALWGCAYFAGLRVGEIRGLHWRAVDFDAGVIVVEHGWDDVEGLQDVKTEAGNRKIPLAGTLRGYLLEHYMQRGRPGGDVLVFGRTADEALDRRKMYTRVQAQWHEANRRLTEEARAEGRTLAYEDLLHPLTFHEARHTCASYLIAAGLNPKQLQTYIGHSSIATTFDIYGHLFDQDALHATGKIDAYLEAAATGI